jgi:acid phosphatase
MPWVNASAALLTAPSPTAQKLYISFTHREEPPLALTTLGLFNNSAYTPSLDVNTTMPASSINFARAWRTSDILPFLGHVALERLECPGLQAPNSGNSTAGNSTSGEETSATSFVRALVNGAPIPFPACQDGPGASCALGEFVGYIQERAQRYGDFDAACGVNATNATNVLGIYQ